MAGLQLLLITGFTELKRFFVLVRSVPAVFGQTGGSAIHFRSIQALRAIAALLVVFFHINPVLFEFGWVGVDLFFVISGFIMGKIGTQDRPVTFIVKRGIRIIPLYWLATLAMCAIALVMPQALKRFTFDAPSLVQSLLFVPYFDADGNIWPLLGPGWTLNSEMFFYALFALALLLPSPRAVVLAMLVALVGIGLVLPGKSAVFLTWTSPRLLEFGVGIGLSMLRNLPGARVGLGALLAGSAGLAAAMIRFPDFDPPVWERIIYCLPALTAIVLGVLAIEAVGRWPGWMKPLEAIGDLSYSLYLLHFFAIAIVKKLIPAGFAAGVAELVLSLAMAQVSYRLIETRFSSVLRNWLLPRKACGAIAPAVSG